MRFGVLGPLAVWTTDGVPVRIPEAKVRVLLAALLTTPGRPVPIARLVDRLWGADLPGDPANSLQTKVSQLRRALEDAEPGSRGLVERGPAGYRLAVDAAEAVDAVRFAELGRRARTEREPRARCRLLTEALALWRGEAFADVDDASSRAAAADLDEQRLVLLEERAEVRLELGEHGPVAADLADQVRRHPLRERLRRAHLRALYGAGRQGEALEGFRDLRERLADELGVDPGGETLALHRAILAQDPGLTPAPGSGGGGNLPVPVSSLVGRDSEVGQVREQLDSARVVTLTGPGGVGKTRLAIEVCGLVREEGRGVADGVWLAELASALDRLDVVEAVAAVLGVRDLPGRGPDGPPAPGRPDAMDQLVEGLRAREVLLLLDNGEHVVDAAAELVARLLRGCPRLRVLVTSQEPLAIDGEVVVALGPLTPPSPAVGSAALADNGAVRLFAQRAAAAAPGFRLDADTAPLVADLCRRLDGLPLAIELAAARVRGLGLPALAAGMDDRFRLLGHGRRDAPHRQRTLRSTIDWTWNLLSDDERVLLRRLSVYRGGADADAVSAVCGDDTTDTIELLTRLVDKSLVVATGWRGGVRYHLLESVGVYAAQRLDDAGEAALLRDRHAGWYLALAEDAAPHLYGPEQRSRLNVLDTEAANLRRAVDNTVDDAEATATRLVTALAWPWFLWGRYEEAHRWITRARQPVGAPDDAVAQWSGIFALLTGRPVDGDELVALSGPADPVSSTDAVAGARRLATLAEVLARYGHQHTAETAVAVAGAAARDTDDRWSLGMVASVEATIAVTGGRLDLAQERAGFALRTFRELGERWGQIRALTTLAERAQVVADYGRAAALHGAARDAAEELRLWPDLIHHLTGLGRIALLVGDLDQAEDYHRRAHHLAEQQSDTAGQEHAAIGLGLLARRRGRLDEADTHFRDWLDWNRGLDSEHGLALIATQLGFIAEQRGDADAALALHHEALGAARRAADPRAQALALEGLAGATLATGDTAGATRLLATADGLREAAGAPLPPAERGDVDRIRAALRESASRTPTAP